MFHVYTPVILIAQMLVHFFVLETLGLVSGTDEQTLVSERVIFRDNIKTNIPKLVNVGNVFTFYS